MNRTHFIGHKKTGWEKLIYDPTMTSLFVSLAGGF
jgi:hypothetical protein